MSKEPDRRYSSAAALAEDIRRCLGDEPILARSPGAMYRFIKFSRRNRAAVVGIPRV